jgi:hypothetical protein
MTTSRPSLRRASASRRSATGIAPAERPHPAARHRQRRPTTRRTRARTSAFRTSSMMARRPTSSSTPLARAAGVTTPSGRLVARSAIGGPSSSPGPTRSASSATASASASAARRRASSCCRAGRLRCPIRKRTPPLFLPPLVHDPSPIRLLYSPAIYTTSPLRLVGLL